MKIHLIRDNGRFEPYHATHTLRVTVVHIGRDISADPDDITDLPAALHEHATRGVLCPLPRSDGEFGGPDAPELVILSADGMIEEIYAAPGVQVTLHDIGKDIHDTPERITPADPITGVQYAIRDTLITRVHGQVLL